MPPADDPPSGRVSVCMATYNGQDFVREQIESILGQLGPDDELVIADDASTDATLEVLEQCSDARIRVLPSQRNGGHVRTFERAMAQATGSVVLLADQDDLWPPGRVAAMRRELTRYPVVAGNLSVFGGGPAPALPPLRRADTAANLRNVLGVLLGRRTYFGSAMGYRGELRRVLLPMPMSAEAHDLWLALAGCLNGGVAHVEEPVVLRRSHGGNLTPTSRRGWAKVVRTRLLMLAQLVVLVVRRFARR